MEKCPICQMPAKLTAGTGALTFDCAQCGNFKISSKAEAFLRADRIFQPKAGTVSGWIRRNAGLLITSRDIPRLRELRTPTVSAKASSLLLAWAKETPRPGDAIANPIPPLRFVYKAVNNHISETRYPDGIFQDGDLSSLGCLAVASASDARELIWLIEEFLSRNLFLAKRPNQTIYRGHAYEGFVITALGWREVERLGGLNKESPVGFVAMSFRREFDDLYKEGIAPGIALAGYEAFRIDGKEHNNRIDDEIIASIKTSRFLIADFTVNRGGIYFEAGFALGLGLPVIWLVNSDRLDCVHFDNRQYNFVRWKVGEWQQLQRALQLRIEATIGRGPVLPS